MMVDDSRDGINDPLPVKSREEASGWAKEFVIVMADRAGAKVKAGSEVENFSECVGKNDEVAEDGRFKLRYYVRAELKTAEHISAVTRLRESLGDAGYEVSGTRTDPGDARPVILDMRSEKENVLASAVSTGDDIMTFSVVTGCFLPPGAEQQQF